MSHAEIHVTIDDTGEHISLHRADLPAVADPIQFDIYLSFEELQRIYLEARRKHLTIDDPTGGL